MQYIIVSFYPTINMELTFPRPIIRFNKEILFLQSIITLFIYSKTSEKNLRYTLLLCLHNHEWFCLLSIAKTLQNHPKWPLKQIINTITKFHYDCALWITLTKSIITLVLCGLIQTSIFLKTHALCKIYLSMIWVTGC